MKDLILTVLALFIGLALCSITDHSATKINRHEPWIKEQRNVKTPDGSIDIHVVMADGSVQMPATAIKVKEENGMGFWVLRMNQ